jgi:hypothetical protein
MDTILQAEKKTLAAQLVGKGYSEKLAANIAEDLAAIFTEANPLASIAPTAHAESEPLLKPGQRIQIKAIDSTILVKHQPISHGVVHWIYADVLEVLDNSLAMVIVNHPGNLEHGVQKVVTLGQYRTKADVQAEIDALPANPINAAVKDLKRSLTVQVSCLT